MKKIISFTLTFLISIIIFLLCLSYGIKDACINTISSSLVKTEVTSKIILSVKKNYNNVSYEILEEIENNIGNNPSINSITTKYFDEIINSVTMDSEINVPDTKEELLSLIDENEYVLKKYNIEFTKEEKEKVIDEIINKNQVNEVYEKVVKIINKNLSKEQKLAANLYKTIISKEFRYICFSLIILFAILIIIIKRNIYKVSVNLAISEFISGISITCFIPLLVNTISNKFTTKLVGESININITKLTNLGYLSFALAALFLIIYFAGNKLTNSYSDYYMDSDTVI